jgi:CheY-like chemotaxis protein
VCVRDGQQALDALESEDFDVVLMDCHMPVLDGFAATRELRRREAGGAAHLPIIALTASSGEEERRACHEAGMDDFLSKPFHRQQLTSLLARVTSCPAGPPPASPLALLPGVARLTAAEDPASDHSSSTEISTVRAPR